MKLLFQIGAAIVLLSTFSCNQQKQKTFEQKGILAVPKDSIIYSFAFMGCNRVGWDDVTDSIPSTANKGVLERIFEDMTTLSVKPDAFFFLGDLVLAESTLENLDTQLAAWVKLYENTSFSQSGIKLFAVPGNHEMLYSKKVGPSEYKEYPLKGATELWLKHMSSYMPQNREIVGGADSLANRLTYSFQQKNIGFIVMNTDTYNPPTTKHPLGLEGQVPTQWVLRKIKDYQANPEVKHIIALGHRPYYIDGDANTGHDGLPDGPILWPAFHSGGVSALLSAHVHDYQRMQPGGSKTYQIIAGNGGSSGPATFFGYSLIHVWSSGRLQYVARGIDVGNPFDVVTHGPFTVRDSTTLTWGPDQNPYKDN